MRKQYELPKLLKKWERIVPSDFKYGTGGIDALRSGTTSKVPDKKLWKQGVYCEYGAASEEEDFNVIAGELWTGSRSLWEGAKFSERLYQKIRLVIEVYQSLDDGCDEAYFLGFVK